MAGTIVNNPMRVVPGLIEQVGLKPAAGAGPDTAGQAKFSDLLTDLVSSVNDLQNQSGAIQDAFLAGEPVELHQVMIKAEEAGISLELLMEIRNKLVSAYNEIVRMPM